MARLIKINQKMPKFDTSTPEGAFSQGIAIKKRDFQKHYNLERDAIIRRGRAKKFSNRQINQYLDQLNSNADRKALELKQEEEIGLIKVRGKGPSTLERQFQEITKLEAGGTMSPKQAKEARTRMRIGPTAASVYYREPDEPSVADQRLQQVDEFEQAGIMSPEQAKEARRRMKLGPTGASVLYRKKDDPQDPMTQYGKLDIHRNRIETRIKDFRISPAEKGRWGWRQDTPGKGTTLETFEPTLMGKNKKGETTGNWRKATIDEIQEYGALTKEQKRVTAAQRPIMSGMMSSAVNSPRIGGSIQDQAKKYIQNRSEQQQQEPEDFGIMSAEELRRITEGR